MKYIKGHAHRTSDKAKIKTKSYSQEELQFCLMLQR